MVSSAFFSRITIATWYGYRCAVIDAIRVIYTGGQLSKQIIQLIDYSDVSSGLDSIQAADERHDYRE